MDAIGGGGGGGKRASSSVGGSRRRSAPIHSLGTDLLCSIFCRLDHVHLIRCSATCKSWNHIIFSSTLMRDLYYTWDRGNPNLSAPSETTMKSFLEDLAMEQHRSGFLATSARIHQWTAHSVRINLCRMKRGLILTGEADKVMRLWSAESYKCLDEYAMLDINPLVDYDFDENKTTLISAEIVNFVAYILMLIPAYTSSLWYPAVFRLNIVGLASTRMYIIRRNGKRNAFQFHKGSSTRGLCMRYIDPEAVVGCDDGRARVLDMYSGSCSRIIRMHGQAVTCMALTEQLIFGGSTFGTISVADLSTGELIASLKSYFLPTGIKSLCFNMRSHLLYAGSSAGYAHCWDLRTLKPLWETRVSPNVIYSVHHLPGDKSTLVVGGLDGVLRLLNQNTGEPLSSFLMDSAPSASSSTNCEVIERKRARALTRCTRIDNIPRSMRPPITCLAVGLNKIVTTHNEKYISMWRFQ